MPRESEFCVGQQVYDRRDKGVPVIATLLQMKRHTNGSPKWLCQYPDCRVWVWQADLLPAPVGVGA